MSNNDNIKSKLPPWKNNLILFVEVLLVLWTIYLIFFGDSYLFVKIIMSIVSIFLILKWIIAFNLTYNETINVEDSTGNWRKITEDTQIFGDEIIRLVNKGNESIYKIVGESEIKGFLELLKIDKLYDDGNYFISGTPQIINLNASFLIKDGFEILNDNLISEKEWPKTLDEAIELLENSFTKGDIEKIKSMNIDEFELNYIFLGQYIRNQFGLWKGNDLLITNISTTDTSPDSISEIIRKEFYKKVTSR